MRSEHVNTPGCFADPFDSEASLLSRCACGCGGAAGTHDAPIRKVPASGDREGLIARLVESAVTRALFGGHEPSRRVFMRAMGAGAAVALIGGMFPLEAAKALASEKIGTLEKKDVTIGFMPITCGTPIIMAHPMGFYARYGLTGAVVQKASGWAMIRDWAVSGQTDYAHMLAPMPIAMTLGLGSTRMPFVVPAIENVNGQAITLHIKHDKVKTAAQMKGFRFAVPFDYSMHNLLLRYFLAEGGVNPDTEVQIRVLPPPEMVANLKAGNLDGYLSPDPFNQRAVYEKVGFIFKLTRDLWEGHPCCSFAVSEKFAKEAPNAFRAVVHAIIDATLYSSDPANRKEIAVAIAPRNYLNQPVEVIEQVLTGEFPDGLGNTLSVPQRIDFDPFPWQSMAVWILTQLKRWGYIKEDVDYRKVAESVFLAGDCAAVMREMGKAPPDTGYRKHTIMGKEFNPAEPEAYLNSFSMRKT
ncbi:MAG: ABC transporter substrate-binding protein [Desulfovibrio sp.]|jgi:nitrate/nitrite transport system substrate-binding protein|nr:ABC transporter substrate-binding protein [Desulfovibrio sp.]